MKYTTDVLPYTFKASNRATITRARAFQLATVCETVKEVDGKAHTIYTLDNPDRPGSDPLFAMELNHGFWIITDLERWQQYKRYSPGPLADGTGGTLLHANGVSISVTDLEFIKGELTKWDPLKEK